MSNSSAQSVYSITSSDTVTLTSGTGSSYYYNTGAGIGGFSSDTITISGGGGAGGFIATSTGLSASQINTISVSDISTSQFNWNLNEEFVNCLPDFNRVQKMCKEYPGLKIAYEKFVTTYKLVKDHYDTPEDQRPKP
jgi:hypothetical protein